MRINCSSIIRMTRELWPHLARVQGAVVIVASQAALRPERENSIDCASKWALLYWAQAVGDVARGDGFAIRVLCPGRTDSAMLLEANRRIARTPSLSAGDYARATTQAIPLKRYASVDEIASAALLLAGPPGAALPRILAVTGGEVFS
jgi:2-hydroxycyclohexanecarboxyl-CoA dehydrogenase